MSEIGITKRVVSAISDMLDNCCNLKAGQEVVIAAQMDGLYGGDNTVDPKVVAWIQEAVQARGANPTILWFDEQQVKDKWRVPPVFLAALEASDVFINCSFDVTIEEHQILKKSSVEHDVVLCRNFATTPDLLISPWCQTPYDLVAEIRYQAMLPLGRGGMPYVLDAPNGTHLEGMIKQQEAPYAKYRKDRKGYRPFPEWVFAPTGIENTTGTVVFDRTLSWWSRYLGIDPVFEKNVTLKVENGYIVAIEGGVEAGAIRDFLERLKPYFGNEVYSFQVMHSGVHPCTIVPERAVPHTMFARILDHSKTSTVHMHIGSGMMPNDKYPYRVHLTADIQGATWKVGDQYIHQNGHLMALDHPKVLEVAQKYPDRPGVGFVPRNY